MKTPENIEHSTLDNLQEQLRYLKLPFMAEHYKNTAAVAAHKQ
jgi:hypothetical protein